METASKSPTDYSHRFCHLSMQKLCILNLVNSTFVVSTLHLSFDQFSWPPTNITKLKVLNWVTFTSFQYYYFLLYKSLILLSGDNAKNVVKHLANINETKLYNWNICFWKWKWLPEISFSLNCFFPNIRNVINFSSGRIGTYFMKKIEFLSSKYLWT